MGLSSNRNAKRALSRQLGRLNRPNFKQTVLVDSKRKLIDSINSDRSINTILNTQAEKDQLIYNFEKEILNKKREKFSPYVETDIETEYVEQPCTTQFDFGNTSWIGETWRTEAVFTGVAEDDILYIDSWHIVPITTGSRYGYIEFLIKPDIESIIFTITHDRDSKDDNAWIKAYKNDVLIAEDVSILGQYDPNYWLLEGGSSFQLSANNLTSDGCETKIKLEGRMDGGTPTYITVEVDNIIK